VLCVANLSRFAQPVSLDLTKFAGRQPVEMLGYVPFPEVTTQPYPLTLAPYSFLWLEFQPGPTNAAYDQDASSFPDPVIASETTGFDANDAGPLGIDAFLDG